MGEAAKIISSRNQRAVATVRSEDKGTAMATFPRKNKAIRALTVGWRGAETDESSAAEVVR